MTPLPASPSSPDPASSAMVVAALAVAYITALVGGRIVHVWWRTGEWPLAEVAGADESRSFRAAENLVVQGLAVYSLAWIRWLGDPGWWLAHPHVTGVGALREPLGAGLMVVAAVVLTVGNLGMGDSWCMGIKQAPQPLVTEGVFRHVRHPIYLAMILYFAATAVLMPVWWVLASMVAAVAGLWVQGVMEEEYWLRREPERYGEVLRRTDGYLPLKSLLRWLLGRS